MNDLVVLLLGCTGWVGLEGRNPVFGEMMCTCLLCLDDDDV